MSIIERETFLKLPTNEIAELVRAAGPQVCVFPINGTRRWFILEHGREKMEDPAQAYIDIASRKHIEIFKMCFDYGLDTLLTPIFGSELVVRGDEYMQKIGVDGLTRPAIHPDFLSFYEDYKVSVNFYGNYRKQLTTPAVSHIPGLFDQASKNTAQNKNCRLFYGVFGNDATEEIAQKSIAYFQHTGKAPSRNELVEQYYGQYIAPATLFIGFDKFSVFDYPMLGLGEENLYFTLAPSLYMNEPQLRAILYDHLYSRRVEEIDYANMSKTDFQFMHNFYQEHQQNTFGIGKLYNGIWYPLLLQEK